MTDVQYMVDISRGVPPIIRIDAEIELESGLRVETPEGYEGAISHVQVADGAYYVRVLWDEPGRAPRGGTAGGGTMTLDAFMVVGPRP